MHLSPTSKLGYLSLKCYYVDPHAVSPSSCALSCTQPWKHASVPYFLMSNGNFTCFRP